MNPEQPNMGHQEKTTGKLEISPNFFDMVLPELAEKGILDIRGVTEIQKILREEGPDSASTRLTEIMKIKDKK